MRVPRFSAALLMLAVPGIVRAQSLPLTESEALARLSETSPRVRALRAGIDVARAEVLSAGRWPNPRVIFDRESVAAVTENIFSVGQPLPLSGRRGFEVKSATALVEAAASRSDDALRRARADLRIVFARLISAQRQERELALAHDKLRDMLQVLERRESAGDTAGYDRIRAERERFDLEADQALAGAERARAQGALAGFFEGAEPSRVVAVGDRPTAAELPPVAALFERAMTVRGELLALRREDTAAQWAAAAAERRRIPEPEVMAGMKTSSAGSGDVGGVLGVQMTLPFFDRGRPERALAEAQARQATARAEAFEQSLRADIVALRESVIVRRTTAERYRESAVRGAEQIERVARVSYEAGERGILELLDAYRAATTSAARQAELDLAVREAEVELEFVSGWEIP